MIIGQKGGAVTALPGFTALVTNVFLYKNSKGPFQKCTISDGFRIQIALFLLEPLHRQNCSVPWDEGGFNSVIEYKIVVV